MRFDELLIRVRKRSFFFKKIVLVLEETHTIKMLKISPLFLKTI